MINTCRLQSEYWCNDFAWCEEVTCVRSCSTDRRRLLDEPRWRTIKGHERLRTAQCRLMARQMRRDDFARSGTSDCNRTPWCRTSGESSRCSLVVMGGVIGLLETKHLDISEDSHHGCQRIRSQGTLGTIFSTFLKATPSDDKQLALRSRTLGVCDFSEAHLVCTRVVFCFTALTGFLCLPLGIIIQLPLLRPCETRSH